MGHVRGGVPKRSTGADCKSAGLAFTGSNPVLPTFVVKKNLIKSARVAQLVERQPSKLRVAGSNPVSRSN